jgi:hypothetical protein
VHSFAQRVSLRSFPFLDAVHSLAPLHARQLHLARWRMASLAVIIDASFSTLSLSIISFDLVGNLA